MPRRKKASRPATTTMPWRPAHRELFRLAGDWPPPATVQVRQTTRGFTLSATFRNASGHPVKLTTRLRWICGEDRLAIDSEEMSVAFKVGGRQ